MSLVVGMVLHTQADQIGKLRAIQNHFQRLEEILSHHQQWPQVVHKGQKYIFS